ncbi:hypothetical protein G3R49_11925 [Shewanella sp. WXL01]|uniref:Uncharacterized protein n=2 Tax=Shewanellaceae TaxID=267890 RepID=A0A411PN64_9GAMM|nr:hypothetical protein [Shewanella sp. WXL01]QBF84908.1 hypothetical protein EXU30_13375 [Shewanella maritima]
MPVLANTSLEQQLIQCGGVQDKLDRLICYDKLAASVGTMSIQPVANSTEQAPPVVVANTASVSTASVSESITSQQQEFGLKKKVEEEVEKISATIVNVKKDPYDAFIITLDNGQVWKQSESRRYKLKPGQVVSIETGMFGSFNLGVEDRNSTTRVKRVK